MSRLLRLWELAKRVYQEFSDDRTLAVAGGVTFFGLLALFPSIACLFSLYGIFGDRAAIAHTLTQASGFLPSGAVSVLGDELHRLSAQKPSHLGLGVLLTFGIALWSSSGGIKALLDGLNIAYEVKETRSFVRITLLALLFTLMALVFMVSVVALVTVYPRLVRLIGLGKAGDIFFGILVWPIAYALCVLLFAMVYRFGPDRKHPRWQWITLGSAIASAMWILGTAMFTWYVGHYGSYNRTYGALGSVIGFLTWIWLSLVILLAGAELNCELERTEGGEQDVPRMGSES